MKPYTIALIDLNESATGCNNKDKAGTFGNASHGEDIISKIYSLFKHRHVDVPVVHFGYLAAIFRKAGHRVRYYDGKPKDEEIVIIASSIVGYDEEIAFAKSIRYPGRKIGFVLSFATVKPELFVESCDFIIRGEPEGAAIELANGTKEFQGVIDSKLLTDLDALPFPDWDGFPFQQYGYFPVLKKRPLLSILTSRGCSFDCSYCPYMVIQTSQWRKRSAHNVVDEIEYLQKKHGIRSLVFRDAMYTQSKQRTFEISEEILRRGLQVEWSCETRADCLDDDMLRLMHKSGLRAIHLGIESPVDEILQKSGRKAIHESQQEKVIRLGQEIGIKIIGFYILGFLSDTKTTMQATIDYAKRMNTPLAQFDVMTPYPGTRFFEEIKDRIEIWDWKKYTTHHPVVRLDHLKQEEVLQFKNKAYREYYLRPAWLLRHGLKVIWGN